MQPSVIEVFFDGACPLGSREVAMLRRRDLEQRVLFTDISSPAFDPASLAIDQARLMAQIHGRLPDGEIVTGVEVFRRIYAALGFPRLSAWSRAPLISHALEVAYALFAKNRLRLTGRCSDDAEGVCASPAPGAH